MNADVAQLRSLADKRPAESKQMPFPVDGKWIEATQNKLGVVFPASFVVAMARMNGGEAETGGQTWQLFPFLDQSDRKRVRRTCNSICRETHSARAGWSGFPADAVAVGKNGCGDILCLLPDPSGCAALQHTVYWWAHETGELHQAANDFNDLHKH
ncbi:MAG: SMI1/KNR4 family protein [Planctomycetota bacterium]